jgi:hypothetical protein
MYIRAWLVKSRSPVIDSGERLDRDVMHYGASGALPRWEA